LREYISKTKRVVIKIGTNLLIEKNNIDDSYVKSLAKQISKLKKNKNIDVVIVSSGSIGLGLKALNLKAKAKTLPEKQAAAAIGQSRLMHTYNKAFEKRGLLTAQVLITQEDFRDRVRYINAKNTINTLLAENVIPIINENDTVAVDEIKFGDNDILSAHITNIIGAEVLIVLSSVDGLIDYSKNAVIREVLEIDDDIMNVVSDTKTDLGTGGMRSKLEAGRIVNKSGEYMIIANGKEKNIILRLIKGEEVGTIFIPLEKKLTSRKRWIAFNQKVKGEIFIDEGAKKAILDKGKSLLPIGILKIKEYFSQGDLVSIVCNEKEIAKGLVNYDTEEVNKIKGFKTSEIEKQLGEIYYKEVIHRDNMVVMCEEKKYIKK
jgi:glutamate 5-kinase